MYLAAGMVISAPRRELHGSPLRIRARKVLSGTHPAHAVKFEVQPMLHADKYKGCIQKKWRR
jgi:hypothetical protein